MVFDAIEYTQKKIDAPASISEEIPPTYTVCMHFRFNQKINSPCSCYKMQFETIQASQ